MGRVKRPVQTVKVCNTPGCDGWSIGWRCLECGAIGQDEMTETGIPYTNPKYRGYSNSAMMKQELKHLDIGQARNQKRRPGQYTLIIEEGCHGGCGRKKWVDTQPRFKICPDCRAEEEAALPHVVVCEVCGETFRAATERAKICSSKCSKIKRAEKVVRNANG